MSTSYVKLNKFFASRLALSPLLALKKESTVLWEGFGKGQVEKRYEQLFGDESEFQVIASKKSVL